MPCVDGVPCNGGEFVAPRVPPWNALDPNRSAVEFRGFPAPLSWWQQKGFVPTVPQHSPPTFFQSRPYSRGADAFAPQFGVVPINPIGAGVPSTARMPTITGPGARYVAGSIWWTPQNIATSLHLQNVLPFGMVQQGQNIVAPPSGMREVLGAYRVG